MSNVQPTGGVGVFGMLGVLFVALKLMDYIQWSWWWVTAPFWGGAILGIVALVALLCVWAITQSK